MKHTATRRHHLAAITTLLVAGSTLLSGCDPAPDTLKIGVAQPLTGNISAMGQDLLNGVKLAVDELNKEGFKIKGKPVVLQIVAMDDASDPATGVAIAKKMVESGVVAVIGNLNSSVSIAAAPIYAEAKIAQLSVSTNPKFTELGLATTFRLVANDTKQARAMGSFASKQLDATRFAVVDSGTFFGKGLAADVLLELQKARKDVVFSYSTVGETTSFDELAAKVKAGKVEVVVTTHSDYQILALLHALKKIDYTDVNILGGDPIKTSTMLKGFGIVKGLYATSPILEAKEFVAGVPFLDHYRAVFRTDPAYGAHYTYDAMYVLAGAIRRADSASPEKITEVLRSLEGYAPVTGAMTWDAKGEQRYGVVGVYAARANGWEMQLRSDRW